MRELDVRTLRATEFPWMDEGDAIYLNVASTGPYPARTVSALREFSARRAQPHTIAVEEQFAALSRSRTLAAELIGAAPEEVAVAINTSYGLNLAARSLPLEPGDVGRHVRLDGVEAACRGRERPGIGDGGKCGELAEIHRSR